MKAQMPKVHTGRVDAPKPHTLVASDRVEGTPVRRLNGEKIGTIQRLMIDKVSGHVAYAVLCFGGFLGMGRKHMPVPWERLKYDPAREAYLVDLTDEEFSHAPEYEADDEFDWGDRSHEIVIRNYYRSPQYSRAAGADRNSGGAFRSRRVAAVVICCRRTSRDAIGQPSPSGEGGRQGGAP